MHTKKPIKLTFTFFYPLKNKSYRFHKNVDQILVTKSTYLY